MAAHTVSLSGSATSIELVEVGPRDGLQNEKTLLSTGAKIELIHRLESAGAMRIEVASFVHPLRVPQMADAESVVAGLRRTTATRIGLALNQRGALRAIAAGVDEIGAVCVSSDGFGIANQGQSIEDSIAVASAVVALARDNGRPASITIAVAFGCPFSGEVEADRVIDIARRVAVAGPVEIGLADTIGVAVPRDVSALVARVSAAVRPLPVRVHFHDTRSTGIANVWAAVAAGAATVDASIGGLGGCPFAPGASGNVATEDVAYLLHRSGHATGYDLTALCETSTWLANALGRSLPGAVSRVAVVPMETAA
jgi:hydroxymethylglutaryl-CoA lyase